MADEPILEFADERERMDALIEALEVVANGDVDVSDTAIIVGNGASKVLINLRGALANARGEAE